jgi:hypothetical protein
MYGRTGHNASGFDINHNKILTHGTSRTHTEQRTLISLGGDMKLWPVLLHRNYQRLHNIKHIIYRPQWAFLLSDAYFQKFAITTTKYSEFTYHDFLKTFPMSVRTEISWVRRIKLFPLQSSSSLKRHNMPNRKTRQNECSCTVGQRILTTYTDTSSK